MAKEKKNNELSNAGKILGSKGGLVGGKKRAENLSHEEMSRIARLGGEARAAKLKSTKKKVKKKKK